MTFGELYRDVYSKLALDGDDHEIYFDDISKSINDAIRELRVQYIQQGMGHEFSVTEAVTNFSEDADYPFVKSDTLSNKIMQDLPIEFTVLSSTAFTTDNTIEDNTQSFTKGEKARKGGKLYECVSDFTDINTFNLTFDPDEVRNYYRKNGLKYDIGDIVFGYETQKYYRVTTGFTNNIDSDGDNNDNLEEVYWKEVGTAYAYASHYPFKYLNTIRLFESVDFSEAISILDDKIYVTPNITELRLTYISKWESVKSMDETLDLPDFMIPKVKDRALTRIGQKLNVEMQLLQQIQEQDQGQQEDG